MDSNGLKPNSTALGKLYNNLFRGPKKKKGEAVTKILSTDIVNIFKDRLDPELRDIMLYPVYVQEFSLGDTSIHLMYVGTELLIPDHVKYS